ncbi:8478_t:CDS:2, partial [Paraglomus brasilianum]
MAERVDTGICRAFQGEQDNYAFRSYGKEGPSTRHVSTDLDHYGLGCSESSLELRPSAFKEHDIRRTDRICYEESGTVSQKHNDNTTERTPASINSERHMVEKTKRENDTMHIRHINPLSSTHEQTVGSVERCPNRRKLKKSRHCLGNCAESVPWEAMRGNPQSHKKRVVLYTRTLALPKKVQQAFNVKELFDAFEDKSRIATFIDYEVLNGDLKELIYYVTCVAEFGFDHIIIVGEADCGMIFLD